MKRVAAGFLCLAACGGASEKPAAPPTTSTSAASAPKSVASAAPESESHAIPGGCARGVTDPCVPEGNWERRLCNGSFPDVALLLMSKAMPFTHAFLRGDVDGWNAEGASARAKLKFDEEVLVLEKRSGDSGGMQLSGSGGFQVMRWDGNCYTLGEGEVTTHRPPAPKSAPIAWRYLESATKDALLNDAHVKAAYDKRNHECKGAVSGDVTLTCQKADEALSAAVVAAVRSGATVPTPQHVP